jgi:hypothetical protein
MSGASKYLYDSINNFIEKRIHKNKQLSQFRKIFQFYNQTLQL